MVRNHCQLFKSNILIPPFMCYLSYELTLT
nr:MAG TPA: hypothetical protein [Caudoviricetes sp.]